MIYHKLQTVKLRIFRFGTLTFLRNMQYFGKFQTKYFKFFICFSIVFSKINLISFSPNITCFKLLSKWMLQNKGVISVFTCTDDEISAEKRLNKKTGSFGRFYIWDTENFGCFQFRTKFFLKLEKSNNFGN